MYKHEAPTGLEMISLAKIIVNNLQPKLRKLDPENGLLKCDLMDDGSSIIYGPAFGEMYEGEKFNVAVEKYYFALKREIERKERSSE